MNVNGIQSTSNPYAGNSADRNAMGQQEFLQLLVAQMKNQEQDVRSSSLLTSTDRTQSPVLH
jgi:hypothetical protein